MNQSESALPISFPVLLSIYLVIPLTACLIAFDQFFSHGALRTFLPEDPEEMRLITIFFVYPHIIASAHSFLDTEYVSFYKNRLLQAIGVALLLGFVVPATLGGVVHAIVFAAYTNFHVIAQQTGITTMMTGKPDKYFAWWKWAAVLVSFFIYLPVYSDLDISGDAFFIGSMTLSTFLYGFVGVALLVLCLCGYMLSKRSRTQIGSYYVWGNVGMITSAGAFYVMGYPFFAILIPRLIHDLSGFVFYIVHDHNRNLHTNRNYFYRLLSWTGLPIALLTPLLGIFVANLLTELSYYHIIESVMITLAYFHYYTEGFMWKRDSIHRENVGNKIITDFSWAAKV